MKKEMKNKVLIARIVLIIILLLIIVGIILLIAKRSKKEPINEIFDVSKGMEDIMENTRLREYKDPNFSGDMDTAGVLKIDFSDLKGATYQQLGEINEDTLTGVWFVKMGDRNQYNTIVKRINDKLKELKNKYKNEPKLNFVLNDPDNFVVTEKEGIVIGVIASDAGAIASGVETAIYNQNMKVEEAKREKEMKEIEKSMPAPAPTSGELAD